jgi:hypothetical protein
MIEFAPHMPPLANDSYHKHFKYMARARISEFESSYPSQGVVSSQRLRRARSRPHLATTASCRCAGQCGDTSAAGWVRPEMLE